MEVFKIAFKSTRMGSKLEGYAFANFISFISSSGTEGKSRQEK